MVGIKSSASQLREAVLHCEEADSAVHRHATSEGKSFLIGQIRVLKRFGFIIPHTYVSGIIAVTQNLIPGENMQEGRHILSGKASGVVFTVFERYWIRDRTLKSMFFLSYARRPIFIFKGFFLLSG